MIKINKATVKTLGVLFLAGLFLFWFIGWQSIRYDENDKEIGRKVIFTAPMIIVSNIPDKMAGDFIADSYGSLIRDEASWRDASSYFPEVIVEKISCNEVFNVEGVFYTERHGLLKKAFAPDVKFYVLSSLKYKGLVIQSGAYEEYSNIAAISSSDCVSATE